MADHRDILGRGTELHGDDRLGDEFGRHRADDMHAQIRSVAASATILTKPVVSPSARARHSP